MTSTKKIVNNSTEVKGNVNSFDKAEIALGSYKNRGQIVDVSKLAELEATGYNGQAYGSMMRYTSDVEQYIQGNSGSISGFNGSAVPRKVLFDFDCAADGQVAQDAACKLIGVLVQNYEVPSDGVRVYFTGKKGFHIELATTFFGYFTPSRYIHYILKNIATQIINDAEIPSGIFDSLIYQRTRLIRLTNSRRDNGLYKVPLFHGELDKPYWELSNLAKSIRVDHYPDDDEFGENDYLASIHYEVLKPTLRNSNNLVIPWSDRPCVKNMMKGVLQGTRAVTAYTLA